MLANTFEVASAASPFATEWPRVIFGVAPCRLRAYVFTALRPMKERVCVAGVEIVKLVGETMLEITAPAGIPMPVIV